MVSVTGSQDRSLLVNRIILEDGLEMTDHLAVTREGDCTVVFCHD